MGLLEKMPILDSSVVEEAKKGSGAAVSGIFKLLILELSPLRKKDEEERIPPATTSVPNDVDLLGTSTGATSSPLKNEYTSDLYNLVFGANEASPIDQVRVLQ